VNPHFRTTSIFTFDDAFGSLSGNHRAQFHKGWNWALLEAGGIESFLEIVVVKAQHFGCPV